MSDHADILFTAHVRELAAEVGLRGDDLTRKLERFREGRKQFRSTAEDWNNTDFDCLDEAQKELDDCWLYLAKALQKNDAHPNVKLALRLLIAIELLLGEVGSAQTASTNIKTREAAESVTTADGRPAKSTMGVDS